VSSREEAEGKESTKQSLSRRTTLGAVDVRGGLEDRKTGREEERKDRGREAEQRGDRARAIRSLGFLALSFWLLLRLKVEMSNDSNSVE